MGKVTLLEERQSNNEIHFRNSQKPISDLRNNVDDPENRSRRNKLIIHLVR